MYILIYIYVIYIVIIFSKTGSALRKRSNFAEQILET